MVATKSYFKLLLSLLLGSLLLAGLLRPAQGAAGTETGPESVSQASWATDVSDRAEICAKLVACF